MSATEKIAEKYIDEVVSLAPLEAAFTFAIGVCLIGAPPGTSGWMSWLGQNFSRTWYLLDILLQQKVGTLGALLAAGVLSHTITRYALRKLLSFGEKDIAALTRRIYTRLTNLADNPSDLQRALQAATEWRRLRAIKVKRSIRLCTFCLATSLITLALTFRTRSVVDFVVAFSFLLLAASSLWTAFNSYIKAYLPERLLLDASLGLAEFKLYDAETDL